MRLTRTLMADQIAQDYLLDRKLVDTILSATFGLMNRAFEEGDAVEVRGFGTFKPVVRKGRTGRDPRNGQEIVYKDKRKVIFRWSLRGDV